MSEAAASSASAGGRAWRWLAWAWLVVVLALGLQQVMFWRAPAIDTDIMALLPGATEDARLAFVLVRYVALPHLGIDRIDRYGLYLYEQVARLRHWLGYIDLHQGVWMFYRQAFEVCNGFHSKNLRRCDTFS